MANPIENIQNIIKLLFENRIDVNDLTQSQKKEILYQANKRIEHEIRFTDQIMQLPSNSHHDFERLLKGNSQYIDNLYLKNLIESTDHKQPNEPKQQSKILKSYIWKGNAKNELPELYRLMKDNYKLIAPETTYGQFTAVFTGQSIDENLKPIKWIHTNKLLAYFLNKAFDGQDWQSIAGNGKLFKNKKNKELTANDLSVAKRDFYYGLPKDYKMIDMILKTIQKD